MYLFTSATVYVGEWHRGNICGRGVQHLAWEDAYDGTWRDCKRNGAGAYWFANGEVEVSVAEEKLRPRVTRR